MDRLLQSGKKKRRLWKEFECMDLIPYSIAAILLAAELYILHTFVQLYDKVHY